MSERTFCIFNNDYDGQVGWENGCAGKPGNIIILDVVIVVVEVSFCDYQFVSRVDCPAYASPFFFLAAISSRASPTRRGQHVLVLLCCLG